MYSGAVKPPYKEPGAPFHASPRLAPVLKDKVQSPAGRDLALGEA